MRNKWLPQKFIIIRVPVFLVNSCFDAKNVFLIGCMTMLNPTKIFGLSVDCHWSTWRYRPLVWETKRRDMPARVPSFFSFLFSRYSLFVSFRRIRFSFSLIFILSSLIALENGVHPFLRSLYFAPFFTCSIVFLSFKRMQLPLGHLPRRWKVCWFVRWPVVSTPLHMVTYHQSTPATRFALRTPWIFMGRK